MPTERPSAPEHVLRPLWRAAQTGKRVANRLGQLFSVAAVAPPEARRSTADRSHREEVIGARKVRESGGSVVVTIPPEAIENTALTVGDEVVVSTDGDAISVTDRQQCLEEYAAEDGDERQAD